MKAVSSRLNSGNKALLCLAVPPLFHGRWHARTTFPTTFAKKRFEDFFSPSSTFVKHEYQIISCGLAMDSCSTSEMSHNVSLSTCYLLQYGNIWGIHYAVLISRGEQQRAGNLKTILTKKVRFTLHQGKCERKQEKHHVFTKHMQSPSPSILLYI